MLNDLAEKFERASRHYADANGIERDADWFVLKLQEEVGELTLAWNRVSGRGRRKGRSGEQLARDLADEAADVLGHVLLLHTETIWISRPRSDANGSSSRSTTKR